MVENLIRLAVIALALLCLAAANLNACGPFFPNNLLDGGDQAVLVAPVADFQRELERMKLVESRFTAKPFENHGSPQAFADQSSEAELADLVAALKKAKVSGEEIDKIRSAHSAEREKLRQYIAAFERWRAGTWGYDAQGIYGRKTDGEPLKFPHIEIVSGLPDEFADYFNGAILWHNPAVTDKGIARESWERLLARPAAQRKFKSTWAAFMLGKSWEKEDADKAVGYFRQVRELAARGFADSVGLAAASLGLEARIELKGGKTAQANQLYLEQFATGDNTAMNSLRQAATTALGNPNALRELVEDERARRVITAYVISWRGAAWRWEEENARSSELTTRWLSAVEEAGVTDMDSAEKLALAAYRAGRFDLSQRWINRSQSSPVSQWLQAKLLLRAGKIGQAAVLLAQVSRSFPMQDPGTNAPASFADNLFVEINPVWHDQIPIGRQAIGELGVIHLARREYAESLDALLRSGYWMDAAYVAERVLTADELKSYVEINWAFDDDETENHKRNWRWSEASSPSIQRARIRDLLARRLTRENRGEEARPYFTAECQTNLDTLVEALRCGWDESLASEQRARSLFKAATIVRTNGMELIGTEVEPDWAIYEGNFGDGVTAESRMNGNFQVLPASEDELDRAARHKSDPNIRFHYRYQAASLAWEAAKLMPDNSDEKARVLCMAGTWLKLRDPQTADMFYKALVRRCRKTAIGDQADRMRWFPVLDENGNPKPYKPRLQTNAPPVIQQESEAVNEQSESQTDDVAREYPLPGNPYIIHAGDSLASIVSAARVVGQNVMLESLLEANPGLDPARLRIGQRIIIPNPDREASAEENW